MATLRQLKFAMANSIFLLGFVFAAFLAIVLLIVEQFIVQIDLTSSIILIVVLPILFIMFQYLIGPAVVSMSTHLRYLQPGENTWLETTVKDLADKSELPMPRLAVVPENTPNAFVFGRSAKNATLAVHEGLLRNLNKDEVKGVIAHELGHLKHRDYIVMTVLSALPLIAYLVARGTWVATRGTSSRKGGEIKAGLLAIGVISYLVYIISLLCVMRLSRLREHYADAYSAYITKTPNSLESALAKIAYGLSISPKAPSGVRAFYIGDPATAKKEIGEIMDRKGEYDLDHDGVLDEKELQLAMEKEAKSTWKTINNWFSTHPPTFKRIMLLNQIEVEMETGKYTNDRVYAHV